MPTSITRYTDYIAIVDGPRYAMGHIAIDDDTITQIQGSGLVIFKNVFEPEFLTGLRKAITHHDYKHHDYAMNEQGLLHNFSRYDDLLHRERRACKNTSYCMFHWNDDTPQTVDTVRQALTEFGNRIALRPPEARQNIDDDKIGTVIGAHYPPGGCLLSHHFSDDVVGVRDETFDEMILLFSTYGRDYTEGGLYVAPRLKMSERDDPSNYGDLLFIEDQIGAGDLIAFTIKDVYHRVEPVDLGAVDLGDPMVGRFLLAFYYGRLKDYQILTSTVGSESKEINSGSDA